MAPVHATRPTDFCATCRSALRCSLLHTSLHSIAALTLSAMQLTLAYPLWAYSATTVAVHLSVKLLLAYDITSVRRLCLLCLRCQRRLPYLRAVALAIALLATWLCPPLGLALGGAAGFYHGLLLEMEAHRPRHRAAALRRGPSAAAREVLA